MGDGFRAAGDGGVKTTISHPPPIERAHAIERAHGEGPCASALVALTIYRLHEKAALSL
jgi:hypothetical protein